VGANGATYIGSGVGGCAIVALNASGGQIWKMRTPYPATSAISLTSDLVIAGCGRGDYVNAAAHPAGAVLALEPRTGKLRWQAEVADAVLGSLTLGDGKVFCPVRDGTIVALDSGDGKLAWRQRLSDAPILAGVTRYGDFLYAVTSDGLLAVLDAKSGQLIEKHALNDEANPGRQNLCVSTPLVMGGRVFVGSETGGLRCFAGTAGR
jgi:outer membrane protein assembly factor BamB